MPAPARTPNGYLDLLPAIYSSDPFLAQFLRAFEETFSQLENQIADIDRLFGPDVTRDEFLPWLADWVALGLRADWEHADQVDFLKKIVHLYQRRGTKQNLIDLLKIYTKLTPVITEGDDTRPHWFLVQATMKPPDAGSGAADTAGFVAEIQRRYAIAEALIDLQKPAHTTYTLEINFTTMQVGVRSHVGVDTLLGTLLENPKGPQG